MNFITKFGSFFKKSETSYLRMGDKKYPVKSESKKIELTSFEKKVPEAVSKSGARVLILGEFDLPHKENGVMIKTRRYRIRCLTTGLYTTVEKDFFDQVFEI